MDKQLFADLVSSLKEAKAIAHRQMPTARRTTLTAPNARTLREQTGLSQAELARLMEVSLRTLQNWEQARRQPSGPAAALLKILASAPELALKSLHA